ncbi:MAG: aminomethyl transferase family protein, partial [Vicinamibacteria bacterium]
MKRSSLHAIERGHGARFIEVGGREVAVDFGDSRSEHLEARTGAAIADLSCRGRLWFSGADSREFLQRMITNDLLRAPQGEGVYAAMLTAKGKMVSDFVLYPSGDRI